MNTSTRLISRYQAVSDLALREARGLAPHPSTRPYSTYWNEYYVEFVTMCDACKLHPGIREQWNCNTHGAPTPANIRKWADGHVKKAADAGIELLIARAVIRRSDDEEGAVIAVYEL